MPKYDLRCPGCEIEFSASAPMRDKIENRIPCPECGSFELETLFKSPAAYIKKLSSPECPNRKACGSCPHAG